MDERSTRPFEGLGEHTMLSDHVGSEPLVLAEYEAIAQRIADDGRRRVLDWGCGFGYVASFLRARSLDVSLFDFSPGAGGTFDVSLSAFPDVRATVSDDPVRLPYGDGEFDAVLSLGTLEHVQYPEHSLAELRRVLEPGGVLYVYKLPNRFSYVERMARHTGRYWHGKWEHDRVYTRHSATQMIAKSGFEVVGARYRNMFPLRETGRLLRGRGVRQVRAVSDALSSVPLVRNLATNVEVIAVRRPEPRPPRGDV